MPRAPRGRTACSRARLAAARAAEAGRYARGNRRRGAPAWAPRCSGPRPPRRPASRRGSDGRGAWRKSSATTERGPGRGASASHRIASARCDSERAQAPAVDVDQRRRAGPPAARVPRGGRRGPAARDPGRGAHMAVVDHVPLREIRAWAPSSVLSSTSACCTSSLKSCRVVGPRGAPGAWVHQDRDELLFSGRSRSRCPARRPAPAVLGPIRARLAVQPPRPCAPGSRAPNVIAGPAHGVPLIGPEVIGRHEGDGVAAQQSGGPEVAAVEQHLARKRT